MDADLVVGHLYHNYNFMDYASQLANIGLSSLEYVLSKLVIVNASELFTVSLTYIPLEEATDHFHASP